MKLLFWAGVLLAVQSCTKPENKTADRDVPAAGSIPHLEKQGTAARLVVDGEPLLLISGELHNSTCGGLETMRGVWQRMAAKNLNSVIATVSWELVEPEQGQFDFELVDSIIDGARAAGLKLVLIWFGSWKNASSVYPPAWVKEDYSTYPRARDEHGKPLEILSASGEASRRADARAFAMLMRHIREIDGEDHTVVMMQVENEIGVLDHLGGTPGNARRDFSGTANRAYEGPVPEPLTRYLTQHRDSLFPELYRVWKANGFRADGSWEEVFGKSRAPGNDWKSYYYYTEELFSAWQYACYVEEVAAAGKKEYPLPMYVNAWIKQPSTYWPGRYPSGGPLPQVLDVWRAAAPSVDFIAPDIYPDDFDWYCREFTRSGNPLFVPETRGGAAGAARAFYAFGQYGAGCFAPFGIDNPRYGSGDPLDEAYGVLQDMEGIILEHQGKGTMKGILADSGSPEQQFMLGDYRITARLAGRSRGPAGGLIINTGDNEFIAAGRALDLFFSVPGDSMRLGVKAVDEGHFRDGQWVTRRRLNGDAVHASTYSGTGLKMPAQRITIQRISLYRYR